MFTCKVSGIPNPTAWYYNGLPLVSSSNMIVGGSVVTILYASVEHSGMYQCFAENENSIVFNSWTLQVRKPGVYICCVCVRACVHV